MIRGTTPATRLIFKIDLEQLGITSFYITFKQDGAVAVEKELKDIQIDKNIATIKLTQEDTLKLKADSVIEVQARIKCGDEVYATKTKKTTIDDILKEGVI